MISWGMASRKNTIVKDKCWAFARNIYLCQQNPAKNVKQIIWARRAKTCIIVMHRLSTMWDFTDSTHDFAKVKTIMLRWKQCVNT